MSHVTTALVWAANEGVVRLTAAMACLSVGTDSGWL